MKGALLATLCFTYLFIYLAHGATFQATITDLQTIVAAAQPGDTVILKPGTYRNTTAVFVAYGTEKKQITFSGYGVIFTQRSFLRFAGSYVKVEGFSFKYGFAEESDGDIIEFRKGSLLCDHCSLKDVTVVGYNPSNRSIDYKWVSVFGKYNQVVNCTFQNKNHMGSTLVVWRRYKANDIRLYGKEDYHYIGYNRFLGRKTHNNYQNGQEAIRIGTSNTLGASHTIVEYNYFENNNGEPELISSKAHYNIFRFNTVYRSQGAITLRHADYNEVYGNKIYGQKFTNTSGVRVCWGQGHVIYNNYFENLGDPSKSNLRGAVVLMNGETIPDPDLYKRVTNVTIAFNTMRNCHNTIVIGSSGTGSVAPYNITISDNKNPIIKIVKEPRRVVYSNNIVYGDAVYPNEDGFEYLNPLFASSSGYKLSQNSPAIRYGVGDQMWIKTDVDNTKRGTVRDVGAYEFI